MDFNNLICVRWPKSRRKNDKIKQRLGFKPVNYFNLKIDDQFGYLTKEDFYKVKEFGVTKARIDQNRIHPCWYNDARFYPNQPYETPNFKIKT